MLLPTPTPSPPTASVPDPLGKLNSFVEALGNGVWSFVFALIGFGVLAAAIYYVYSHQRYASTSAKVTAGVIGVAGLGFGIWELVHGYNILDEATGGVFGRLITVVLSALPVLIPLIILVLLVRSLGRSRY